MTSHIKLFGIYLPPAARAAAVASAAAAAVGPAARAAALALAAAAALPVAVAAALAAATAVAACVPHEEVTRRGRRCTAEQQGDQPVAGDKSSNMMLYLATKRRHFL